MRKLIKDNQAEALRILLNRLNVKFTSHSIEHLKVHPDYPSLLSLNYALHLLKIDNVATRVSYERLQKELPKPALVHIRDNGGMYLVVDNLDEEKVSFINEHGQLESQPKDDFIKSWSGIAMLVDDEAQGKEENYTIHRIKEIVHKVKLPFAIVSLATLVLYSIYYFKSSFSTFDFLYLFTNALGIAVSIPLVIHLMDKNNPLVKKLCTSNNPKSKANCTNILDSPAANILGIFSWSEIGFIYFATLFFYIILFPQGHAILLVAVLSVLAAPYAAYSIFYQWKIAGQWCRLCLAVQAILLSELLTAIFYFHINSTSVIAYRGILALFLVFSLIISAYGILKPIISEWKSYKGRFPKLNRIRFNPEIFRFLLKKNIPIDTVGINSLQFGNPNGEHRLTIISNPSCQPCIKMHQKLFRMLKTKEDVSVLEIFLTDTDEKSNSYQIAECMLKLYQTANVDYAKNAIAEYYNHYYNDFRSWIQKFDQDGSDNPDARQILKHHIMWCRKRKISSTPMIFYNNYELPKEYSIEDLDYLVD